MVGAEIFATGKTPLVFVDEGVKLTNTLTNVTSWTLWWFLRHVATLTDSNGPFNKIPLQPTERKRLRSGARLIFPTLHLRNGRPTRRISTLWITAIGRCWRPGPVLSPTKIWRRRCSRGDTDCRRTSWGARPRIFGSVWRCALKQKPAS